MRSGYISVDCIVLIYPRQISLIRLSQHISSIYVVKGVIGARNDLDT